MCLNALSRKNLNLNASFDKQICPSNWDSNDQGTKDVQGQFPGHFLQKAACPCLQCILEEAEIPLIPMHDSLWKLKAKKGMSCLALSCVTGNSILTHDY